MNTNESGCIRTLFVVTAIVAVVVAIVAWVHPFPPVGWSLFGFSTPTAGPVAQITQPPPQILTISPVTPVKVASAAGIEIAETGALQTDKFEEIVRLNNCAGTGDVEHISARSMIVNIQGELDTQETQEKLNTKYARASKSLKVVAAPGTWMEFVLIWTEQEWIGVVTQGNEGRATYVVRAPIAVELSSSKNLGCPLTPTPVPPPSIATNIPSTPLPKLTFPPTSIALPTSVPVPTSRPSSLIFTTIPIGSQSELSGSQYNLELAPGRNTLLNIPFDNGWTVTTPCSHLPDRPNPIVFVTQIPRPQEVYILLQAGWALEQYRGKQIGGIKLDFSGGRQSDTPFILGFNIRDWSRNKPNAVNNFSSPTLRSAWQGSLSDGTIGGMDVLTIPVSGENTNSTLTRIELYDISKDTTGEINPCIHLLAITVKHFK